MAHPVCIWLSAILNNQTVGCCCCAGHVETVSVSVCGSLHSHWEVVV